MPKTISPINAISLPGPGLPSAYRKPLVIDPEVAVDPPVTGGPGPLPETVSKGSEKEEAAKPVSQLAAAASGNGMLIMAIAGAGIAYLLYSRK
jgi:hypothetical protein